MYQKVVAIIVESVGIATRCSAGWRRQTRAHLVGENGVAQPLVCLYPDLGRGPPGGETPAAARWLDH